jgi:deoxyribonuclease-4
MPTAGGIHNAILAGKEAGCDLVQVFTKSPQQWKARDITDEQVAEFLAAQDETGVRCLAAHDTYLINPVSPDPDLLQKSRDALVDELHRSARLKIPFVVMHLGTPGPGGPEEGLPRLVETVRYVLARTPADGPVLLLETMAGQGKCLGARFEEVGHVLHEVGEPQRLGVCLDTCHVFAAGYDLRTPDAYGATMAELDRLIGLDQIRLIHANDSKKDLGSRVDRHEAIGRGCLGAAAFELLLRDPRLAGVPVVLETPKKGDDDADMDAANLAALRAAAG